MKSRKGESTACIYGFPYIIRRIFEKYNPSDAYIVFDGGRDQHRKDILPNYKQREPKLGFDRDNFYAQRDVVMDLCRHLGLKVVRGEKFEADDLMYALSRKIKGNKVIISADKDFHQMIDTDTVIYNPGKDVELNTHTYEHHIGYKLSYALDYLILNGDDSDKIPGYPKVGPKTALKFLDKYGSIERYLESGETFKPIDNTLFKEIYTRNNALINLRYHYLKYFRKLEIPYYINDKPIFNVMEIAKICKLYSITTFIKPEFMEPFQKLYNR
jgi:DNA polymerase-1